MKGLLCLMTGAVCALLAPALPTHATVSVAVTDALLGTPLPLVTVYCVESDQSVTTDSDGHTVSFRVPYRACGASDDVGVVTLVLYREGYVACVCELRTLARTARTAVPLSLYPDDGSLGSATQLVEGLPQAVADGLVARAKAKASA